MIQIGNLTKSYGTQVIFEGAGFTVNSGERIGLVGRNGSGKTTLLKMIIGESSSDAGTISFPNNYTKGYLSQHLSFAEDSVLKEVCVGLKPSDDGRDESYKVKSVLSGLGFLSEDFSRRPSDLSGGFQVRLNLAKLLVSEPDMILLDEPTNYLDIVSIRWLTRFLKGWKGELILVTHDREFMDSVTTHTMGIHRNKIKKIEGTTHKLYEQIIAEEEVYEQTRINEEKMRKEAELFINRFRAQATRARAVQSKVKALQRRGGLEKMTKTKNLEFEFVPAPFTGKCLIEAKDISFSYEAGQPLIEGLNLSLGKKDRIAVIGKNGKGKTTLLNLFAGELRSLSGTFVNHPQLKLAYFGQTNVARLDPEKTVEEEMLASLPIYNRNTARNICGVMMFDGDSALKKVRVLSGGEKSRVLLGKLLVSPANLLLLDEPTNHLDMESVDSLLEAIDIFDGAVIIVTHSEMILNALATRLIVFDDEGVRVFEGTYQDFLDKGGWKDDNVCPVRENQDPAKKGNSSDRKDLRRLKADLINSRSRTLSPLQSRISEIEETIIEIEREVEQDTRALIEASTKGDGEAIKRLSKAIPESKRKIDALFDELQTLTDEFDAKSRKFEESLEALKTLAERLPLRLG